MDSSVNAQTTDPADAPKRSRSWRFWLALAALAVFGGLSVTGRMRPENLGVREGQLAPCPDSPNCVSTQGEGEHGIAPLALKMGLAEALPAIAELIAGTPRTKLVTQTDDYLHVECTSLLMRYVDDLEIWIDADKQLVHARSASRVGYSDMGANRKRVEQLFSQVIEAGIAGQ